MKTFRRANGTEIRPVDDVSLTIRKGEFLVLLGPSGCGKTTLLRCIAGLETPDSGQITIHNRPVFDGKRRINQSPEHRRLGMIFQSYALWPHLTVRANVAYPLQAAKRPKREIRERVDRTLTTVGVLEVADQLPGRLSGGQQQRVSLARALVAEPDLILFDEPLSNVDAKVREELRLELLNMQRMLGFTAVYVTHDQMEAMELADRIAVLGDGRIAQLDTPRAVYGTPATPYVARFVGTANELTGTVTAAAPDRITVDTAEGPVALPGDRKFAVGQAVRLIWRPEASRVVDDQAPRNGSLRITATVRVFRFLGVYSEVLCRTASGPELRVISSTGLGVREGDDVKLEIKTDDLNVYADE